MSSQDLITQDMLEVLAQVQTDPQSKLFAKGIKLGAPQSTEQPLTGKEPFLSAAERKLIRAHRERVEAFLYARADKALLDSEWGKRILLNRDEACPTQAALGSKPVVSCSLGTSVRARLAGNGDPVADLCIALSLRPSTRGRILLALAYMSKGRYQAASLQLASPSQGEALSRPDRVLTLLNQGLLAWEKGRIAEVVSSYAQAKRFVPNDFLSCSMALVAALKTGQEELIRTADQSLVGWDSSSVHQSLPDLLRICRVRRVLHSPTIHSSTIRSELAELIIDSLPRGASQ